MKQSQNVVLGFLGSVLDVGRGPDRWENWRPTISVCRQADLLVHRFELLYSIKQKTLAELIKKDIQTVSPETEVHLHNIEFIDPWDFEEVYAKLFDFARAYSFSDAANYLVHITTGTHVAQICLFLLTESKWIPGQLLQTSPERDRSAPGEIKIIDLDLARYDSIATRFRQQREDRVSFLKDGIETRNKSFNKLIDRIEKIAASTRDPILLTGPTGAGKSRLARRIFELKKARHQVSGVFVDVNCATLRGDTAMSTLFGHVKGAFTGAQTDRAGLLKTADQGVLFLDEIGELGADEQAMLLRAIEEKTFHPMGADKPVASDFQLIAGTNRDLQAGERFRDDLLARINLWTFALPGLRDRTEDIEPNLQYELDQYAQRSNQHITLTKEARSRFLEFACSPRAAWAGNFRDLAAAVTRMATLADNGRITAETVKEETDRLDRLWSAPSDIASPLAAYFDNDALAEIDVFDRAQLETVVAVCKTSRSLSDAGRKLFQASRTNKQSANDADRLRKYLQRFGLDWHRIAIGVSDAPRVRRAGS